MKVKAIITLHANGKNIEVGKTVDIEVDEAKRLIARGFASSLEEKTSDSPTIEDVIDAISALDPEKDYGKNGKPNVDAIEIVLDANISATMRDKAWEIFKKDSD